MTDLIKKLVKDMKWRLSPAGRRYRPKKQEIEKWAPFKIPGIVPALAWIAFLAFCAGGAHQMFDMSELAMLLAFGWPAWILSGLLLFKGVSALNRNFVVKAYRGLLERNERFSLVEYNRYLTRRIKQAQDDSSLGGPGEVARLRELQAQFIEMLRGGLGTEGHPVESEISQETEFAEAYIQSYREMAADPMDKLDSRLPPDLMERVQELERQETTLNVPEKQVEN